MNKAQNKPNNKKHNYVVYVGRAKLACERLGLTYRYDENMGLFFFQTRCSGWYFEFHGNKIRLRHENKHKKHGTYHTQFIRWIGPEALVEYAYYHDEDVYGMSIPRRWPK